MLLDPGLGDLGIAQTLQRWPEFAPLHLLRLGSEALQLVCPLRRGQFIGWDAAQCALDASRILRRMLGNGNSSTRCSRVRSQDLTRPGADGYLWPSFWLSE